MNLRLLLILVLGACSTPKTVDPQVRNVPETSPEVSVGQLESLSWGLRGRPLASDERTRIATLLQDEKGDIAAVVQLLVDHEDTSKHALNVLLPQFGTLSNVPYVPLLGGALNKYTGDSGREVYYLTPPFGPEEKCTEDEALQVRPWWATDTQVWVCPSAYQPEKLFHKDGIFCPNITSAHLKDECGCGPYLMLCYRDEEQRNEMRAALYNEMTRTVQRNVEHNDPIAELFTQKDTFREPFAEFQERRNAVAYGQDPDVVFKDFDEWPEAGVFAPRDEFFPGHHAGLLTTATMLEALPGPRQRLQVYADNLWCLPTRSARVDTHAILDLPTNFRVAREEAYKIAHMEGCEQCHARLDYALPYFDTYKNLAFTPPPEKISQAKFYINDLSDYRGEAPATPHGFATMAVSQPEFRRCMSERIVSQVFGAQATKEDHEAVYGTATQASTYRELVTVAATRYLTGAVQDESVASSPPAPSDSHSAGAATIKASPPLVAMLNDYCLDCHGVGDESVVQLDQEVLSKPTLLAMLEEIMSSRMPKGERLGRDEELRFISELSRHVWQDRAMLEVGFHYYTQGHDAIPSLPPSTLYEIVADRTGQSVEVGAPVPFNVYGRDASTYNPTVALSVMTTALEACRTKLGKEAQESALKECVEQATAVAGMLSFQDLDQQP